MGAVELLAQIATAKEDIREAAVDLGAVLPAGSGLRVFAAALRDLGEELNSIPADWPDIRTGLAENSWTGLVELSPDSYDNWAAFSVAAVGGYTVDWGDGTSDTYATNAVAEHQWTWADNGPTLADGTRAAVVRVTAAGPITSIDYVYRAAAWELEDGRPMIWLDLALDTPALTSFNIRSDFDVARPTRLRQISIYQMAITNASNMFSGCSSLTRLPDVLDMSKAASAGSMFSGCSSLTRLPDVLDMSNVTYASNMFYGCSSLTRLSDVLDMSKVASAIGMFSSCSSLTRLPDVLDMSNVTDASYMFNGCSSLTRLSDVLDMSKVANATDMFRGCSSLTRLPDVLDMSKVANATDMFNGCSSLTRLPAVFDCKVSFSVRNAALSRGALDALFTALPTVVGRTVTITGAAGRANANWAIATSKGWTVVA